MGETEIRREIILEGPLYLVPEGRLDWERVFGRRGPVLVDIGAARARYFLAVAQHLPGVNLVGIEVAKKRVEKALEKLEKAGLGERARMVWGNAVPILRDHVVDGTVAAFTVLFPDPWPKKAHAKRRLWQQPEMVELLARKTAPGGLVLIKTDAKAYFDPICEAFRASPLLRETADLTVALPGLTGFDLDRPEETRYETEFKKEGRPIYRIGFRRVA